MGNNNRNADHLYKVFENKGKEWRCKLIFININFKYDLHHLQPLQSNACQIHKIKLYQLIYRSNTSRKSLQSEKKTRTY